MLLENDIETVLLGKIKIEQYCRRKELRSNSVETTLRSKDVVGKQFKNDFCCWEIFKPTNLVVENH